MTLEKCKSMTNQLMDKQKQFSDQIINSKDFGDNMLNFSTSLNICKKFNEIINNQTESIEELGGERKPPMSDWHYLGYGHIDARD